MRAALAVFAVACSSSKDSRPPPPPPTADIALVIAFDAQEAWLGNDEFEPDEAMRTPGLFRALVDAIDRLALPAGSRVGVIAYSTGTAVLQSLGSEVHGDLLGPQYAYRGRIGDDMNLGLDAALDLVVHAPATTRRIVVVLGDGHCTYDDARCTPLLADAKQRADAARVELHAIVFHASVSRPGEIASTFAPHATTIAKPRELQHALAKALTGK